MARSIVNDKLMSSKFHLIDVEPSLTIPPWVLLPTAGFSSITAPEMTLETEELKEGTDPFAHHIIGKGSVNAITLTRGVSAFNSDFWKWITACLMGNNEKLQIPFTKVSAKRRNMLLVHYTGLELSKFNGLNLNGAKDTLKAVGLGALGGAGNVLSHAGGAETIPGVAYFLMDCIPTRYKVASDFDATSSEISIEELDLSYHRFERISLGA